MNYKLIFFILLVAFCTKLSAQEEYLYAHDSATGETYRIKFNTTYLLVETNTIPKIKFNDKVIAMDAQGLTFKNNGYYLYKDITHIKFTPYKTFRKTFKALYFITAANSIAYSMFLANTVRNGYFNETGFVATIWVFTSPLWAVVVPCTINLIAIYLTKQVKLKCSNTIFKTGNQSPFYAE